MKHYFLHLLLLVLVQPVANAIRAEQQLAGEFVDIPGGTFLMGDQDGDGGVDEKPVHWVTIEPFRMGKYEITFAQWDACVMQGGCNDYRPVDEGWGRDNRPVINVSWEDVQAFISWLNGKTGENYRLPSEAEWEYAARAGSSLKYPWGYEASHEHANYGSDECCSEQAIGHERWGKSVPVGQFPPNKFGLFDMIGNVWEWTADCWHASYEGALLDGQAWTTGGYCNLRVCRGGSFNNRPVNIRSAARTWNNSSSRYKNLGFRLVQDNKITTKEE